MNCRSLPFAITLMGICLCSCKQYAVARLGIKEPQVETPESIRQYLLTHDFPTENQYVVKDTSSYYFMLKNLPSQGLIGTLIFDKDLHLITRDTSKCQWSFGEAVSGLSKGQNYQLSENINGSEVLGFLVPLDSTTVYPTINTGDFDFLVINRWAKFVGENK